MIKSAIIAASLAVSSLAFADAPAESKVIGNQKFVTTSDNIYSQLCIAALDSREVVEQVASELGISKTRLNDVTCNGLSLVRFAKAHRGDIQEWFVAQRN